MLQRFLFAIALLLPVTVDGRDVHILRRHRRYAAILVRHLQADRGADLRGRLLERVAQLLLDNVDAHGHQRQAEDEVHDRDDRADRMVRHVIAEPDRGH